MATTTARRTTRKDGARKPTVIPPQHVDRTGGDRMATIYSSSDSASPWQNFQNAGPDCYWEVPQNTGGSTARHRVN